MHVEMEKALMFWIKQVRSANLPVIGELVKEKSMSIATLLNIEEFESRNRWLDNFEQRHGILFGSIQGETGAIMSGTEKLPLLVIGRSKNPRCFKSAKVPVDYTANAKAWMTGAAFEDWLKTWDKRLKRMEGRFCFMWTTALHTRQENPLIVIWLDPFWSAVFFTK